MNFPEERSSQLNRGGT